MRCFVSDTMQSSTKGYSHLILYLKGKKMMGYLGPKKHLFRLANRTEQERHFQREKFYF